jgi:signal transduction histidine kinase
MTTTSEYKKRILVIDDNPNIHEDFRMILSNDTEAYHVIDQLAAEYFNKDTLYPIEKVPHSYLLDFATQGMEGVEKVKTALEENRPYMLAFVDMRIPPGMNGLETIKRIIHIDPWIQIVLCTAYSDYSFREIRQEIGTTSNLLILKKPFDTCEIEQLVSTLTEKWILSKKSELKEEELNGLIQQRTQKLTQINQTLQLEIAERKRAEKSIKILTQENIRIQEKERQRIACDLHDSVAQDLAALLLKQEFMLNKLKSESPEFMEADVKKSIQIIRATIKNVRNISYNLRPPSLNEFGIVHAMSQHCESFFQDDNINVSFISSDMDHRRFDYTTEINLYRIFQEALTNIKNHAMPKNVVIQFSATPEKSTLSIKDDGAGFNKEKRLQDAIQERRMGLKGIEERVNLINGKFVIHSNPAQGTEIIVSIPNTGYFQNTGIH